MPRCREWCPLCYASRTRGDGRPCYAVTRKRKRESAMPVDRPTDNSADLPPDLRLPPGGDAVLGPCPTLLEWLTATRYSDGSPRILPTLLIFSESMEWRVCLNDRDNCRSAWKSGRSPEEALAALERALSEGSVDWRRSKGRT